MVETLKELVALLDTRISVALVENGDWDPEQNPTRPTVTENGIQEPGANKPNKPVNPNGSTSSGNKQDQNAEAEAFFDDLVVVLVIGLVVMLGSGAVIVWMAKRKKPTEENEA